MSSYEEDRDQRSRDYHDEMIRLNQLGIYMCYAFIGFLLLVLVGFAAMGVVVSTW